MLFKGILAPWFSLKLQVRSPAVALGWGSGAWLSSAETAVRVEGAFRKFW